MRPSLILATFVTSAAAACAGIVGSSAVAHADQYSDQTPKQTISQLQSQGYTVNIDRVGSAPIDRCTVTGVRNPQVQTQWVHDSFGSRDAEGHRKSRLVQVVISKSISVSLSC